MCASAAAVANTNYLSGYLRQAHEHRGELYYHTRMDHILWPRRWTLIKEEIEHHRVSGRAEVELGQGVQLLVLVASCRGWVRQCILLGNSGVCIGMTGMKLWRLSQQQPKQLCSAS
jgi:hypothetical protein